jgi:hypothetical protein
MESPRLTGKRAVDTTARRTGVPGAPVGFSVAVEARRDSRTVARSLVDRLPL